jgi:hypothetical protein
MIIRTIALAAVAVSALAATASPSEARYIRHHGRFIWVNRASPVALNPQPLPPRWVLGNRGGLSALNPQPLPPRWTFQRRYRTLYR